MKLNSKLFDSMLTFPARKTPRRRATHLRRVNGKAATSPGRIVRRRAVGRDGQFYNFCVDHVRQYNASYNYFDGMSDVEVDEFRKDALTGHRPTWKAGPTRGRTVRVMAHAARRPLSASGRRLPADPGFIGRPEPRRPRITGGN